MNQEKSLNAVWESYLFTITALVIDAASPRNQTRLIKAIGKAGSLARPNTSLDPELCRITRPTGVVLALQQLETQWKAALKNPLPTSPMGQASEDGLADRWFILNQRQIHSTQSQIDRMGYLIERLTCHTAVTPLQNHLMAHYQGIQDQLNTYLDKLVVAQINKLNRLNRQ